MSKDIIIDFFGIEKPPLTAMDKMTDEVYLSELVDVVAEEMEIHIERLYENNRRRKPAQSRWMVYEIMISQRGYSLEQAAQIFRKGTDHTTVMNGLDMLLVHLQMDDDLKKTYYRIWKRMQVNVAEVVVLRERREFNKKANKIKKTATTYHGN